MPGPTVPRPPERPGEPVGYFRGAAGGPADARRVVTVAIGLVVAGLAALLCVVTAATVGEAARLDRVHRQGISVPVTVTGCVGLGSGTGITTAGYTCRGAFPLDGQRHDGVIQGSAGLLAPGTTLQGVTLRDDPAVLYAPPPAAAGPSPWPPVAFSSLLLLTTALLVVLLLRLPPSSAARSRDRVPPAAASA
jgi:hypothetical protein